MKSKKTANWVVIQFVGKRVVVDPESGKPKVVSKIAPAQIINGGRTIELPPDAKQKKGFTHPDAEFLLKNYRSEFKKKVRKQEE